MLNSKWFNSLSEDNQKVILFLIYFTTPIWLIFLYDGNIALFKDEQIDIDLEILILKSKFVKFLVICLDLIVFYTIYNYFEKKALKVKRKAKYK